MPTLNPCPICGKQPVTQCTEGHYPPQYKLFCGVHVSVGDWFPNTQAAENDWNRRTTDPMQPDLYKPTNTERFRAMSDEELAASENICTPYCQSRSRCKHYENCTECKRDWLSQPAEEALGGGAGEA